MPETSRSRQWLRTLLCVGVVVAVFALHFRFVLVNFSVGATPPDIEGKDAEGKPLKLSDFRGKVVLLDFFADWCPHCVAMYPHEQKLVKKFAGRPFALLGINADSFDTLRQVIGSGKVSWRCWPDGPNGPIAHLATVIIGQDDGATVQIVHGINPGDKVIQDPPDSLIEGQRVTPVTAATEPNAGGR